MIDTENFYCKGMPFEELYVARTNGTLTDEKYDGDQCYLYEEARAINPTASELLKMYGFL